MDVRTAIGTGRPVIGMVHLLSLPGSPGYSDPEGPEDRAAVHERARADARKLEAGGVDAVLVENHGDAPFYPDDVPDSVVAEMTAAVREVVDEVDVPVGVNVLRNDGAAALSVAAAAGGAFVRINNHTGVAAADQGLLEGKAHETMRLREAIDARDVAVIADVDVKHAAPIAERPFGQRVRDLVTRGLVDGIVVSGNATGDPTPVGTVRKAKSALREGGFDTPVLAGSGVTAESVGSIVDAGDGAIVGTALEEGGETGAPVDTERVRELVAAADEAR